MSTTKNSGLADAVAGFTAGLVSTIIVHPLDLIRLRLQADRSTTSTLGSSLRIIREISSTTSSSSSSSSRTSLITAFYRGISPNLIGNTTSWGIYFFLYGQNKKLFSTYRSHTCGGGHLSYTDYLIASGVAGVFTSAFTNPIWVVKTRMMTTNRSTAGYGTFTASFLNIVRNEGVKGLYRGFLPSMFGVVQASLQFMSYEKMKIWRREQHLDLKPTITTTATIGNGMKVGVVDAKKQNNTLSMVDFVAISSLSKAFSVVLTYPYQVIRTRLQMHNASELYSSARDVVRQTWLEQGALGFYRGMGTNLLRVLPATCITFLTYEKTRAWVMEGAV